LWRAFRITFSVATPGGKWASRPFGARPRDDLVVLGGDDERRRGQPRCVPRRLVAVAQQPRDRQVGEARRGERQQAVVWRDEDEPRHRPGARHLDGDAGAEAAADDLDRRMLAMDEIEQREGIADERGLRRLAAASSVAAVVEKVERVVRERRRQFGDAHRHVLAVAAQVDDRLRAGPGPGRCDHVRVGHGDDDQRVAVAERRGLREVDQRALDDEDHEAQADVGRRGQGECNRHSSGEHRSTSKGRGCSTRAGRCSLPPPVRSARTAHRIAP
jgi:hypothetical protein